MFGEERVNIEFQCADPEVHEHYLALFEIMAISPTASVREPARRL